MRNNHATQTTPNPQENPEASSAQAAPTCTLQKLHIVLFEPEIPQNTGNIARTCACIGAKLHLVEPMGFRLTEKHLGRAAMDYWDAVDIQRYPCVAAFLEAHKTHNLFFFTGQTKRSFAEADYGDEAYLIFGRESRGLDQQVIDDHADRCLRIPMEDHARSLNLSNAVAIAAYEVLRSWNYPHLV